ADILRQIEQMGGPYVPVLARLPDRGGPPPTLAILPMSPEATPAHLVARLTSALRVRAMHATVQRRAAAQDKTTTLAFGGSAALDQATVLVAGRGGGYPALTLAVGERVGLIGALSLETAKRYLEGRDIDGIVIGDGFSARAVETFLDALGSDVRFRDLPIVVA